MTQNPAQDAQFENVCFKASYAIAAFAMGLIISGVALWFGIWGH